jgi:hypothetical protein
MRLFRAIALIFVSVLFFQCQKEISQVSQPVPNPNPTITNPEPISARLQGNVYNENGQPAQGVTVKVGSQTATTDAKGNFRFDNASLDKKSALVIAEMSGYFRAYRTFAATSGTNYVSIKLIKKTLAGTIDASAGGSVSLSNGAKVALPANGVVKASNSSAYTGTVNVYAAYIDPTASDIDQTVPGSFMAEDKNGKRVTLASFGMMAVELESTSAERLQIKSGSKATLTTPIPASSQANAPASIALWSVNEQTGIWKEEGTATKSGNVYVGDVSHFSFWNCDISFNAVVVTMTVQSASNQPIVHAHVRIKRTSSTYNSQGNGWTDSLGQVSGYVPANETLILEILDPCGNVVYTQNIGPFTQNTNIGTITATIPNNAFVTISGHMSNCSGGNVTSGYAIIYYNNVVRYAYLNNSGDFSTNFLVCSGTPATAQVVAIDNGTQQQSALATVTVTAPGTNAGNFTACGTSALQYVNFDLDGVAQTYNSQVPDSLMAYTVPQQGTGQFSTLVSVSHNAAPFGSFYFSFMHPTLAAGTYPATQLTINNSTLVTLIQPFNIVVTNFPQNIGEYYEGTFSGMYMSQTTTHVISNGTFRIRKTF